MKKASIIVLLWCVASVSLLPFVGRPKKLTQPMSVIQIVNKVVKDDYIASEIAKSKFPTQLAAIKSNESPWHGPLITGDGGKSIGLFQIQPRLHGKFDLDVPSQVKKAEEVLEKFIRAHGPDLALQKWNGEGRDARAYQKRASAKIKYMQS